MGITSRLFFSNCLTFCGWCSVIYFKFFCYKDISEGDKADNENENVSIPLLLRNALPDVEGFDKDEKLDIAMRPDQVS